MSVYLRVLFMVMMTVALGFGYAHHLTDAYNFERLHIFLFNLCTGGTIILFFTEGEWRMTPKTWAFFILSFIYAILAFMEIYSLSIVVALAMVPVVEAVRIRKFGRFFPMDFFTLKTTTAMKFHQASLLCLSMGLVISSFAIINDVYYQFADFDKLELNTFFLGFSFPLSLITFSLIFTLMHKGRSRVKRLIKVGSFWTITLGVIIFFIFILFESIILEFAISSILFVAVYTVFILYINLGMKEQQKSFLTSGIVFLIATAITGILYISLYFFVEPSQAQKELILSYHRIVSLYGWNLSGLAVICRFNDFPIRLHSGKLIVLHWIIVVILAPAGYYSAYFAVLAIVTYAFFVYNLFFSRGYEEMPPFEEAGA
ncbi:hypothetical protein [Limisalsivibrio acetivorans]|uniref:hypothetical protein n=1 Tax=Limisalsivibrio acetivorans TaxID=1304888 RepID=UPI0003B55397|nr:hypothetical protein [Limisalsivibrio acetivorans]